MRRLSLAILAAACLLVTAAGVARASSCLTCHPGAGKMSESHPLSCVECHGGNPDDSTQTGAHEGMRANPSDMTNPAFACGRCHEDQARRVNRTLMSTMAGIISQTRFLLGAQKDVEARYAVREIDNLRMLHKGDDSGPLADDLLRRRCLRCHLGAVGNTGIQGAGRSGPTAAGCAACHVLNEKIGMAPDQRASQPPGARGMPSPHRLTTAVPTTQCLQCHNGNRVGADYAGLFERDHSLFYNFEASDPEIAPHLMKHSYHYLLPDIHQERGMHCIDCHPVEELMGEGRIHSQAQEQVGVRCQDCHGLPGKPPRTRRVEASDSRALRAAKANGRYGLQVGSNVIVTSGGHLLTNTVEKAGNFLLASKVDGKVHKIPVLGRELPGKEPLNHRIPGHMDKMECTACHAAWTYQDMGLHLVRQDSPDYEPWTWLTRQGDPQAREILETNLFKRREQWSPPSSRDWLTGFSKIGVWLGGYSMRRWEGRVLGLNSRGRVSAMRPHYQYWLSWVDTRGQAVLDSVIPQTGDGRQAVAWNPYAPHTVRPQTVDCWDCHGNTRALGLGQTLVRAKDGQTVGLGRSRDDGLGIDFDLDRVIDEKARPLQITSRTGAGFLTEEHLERMSARNPLYIRYLLEFFKGKEAWGDPAGFTGPKK
ncbi:MAG: hypothetical protein ABFD97_05680 [Syntrophobacter sp.]